MFLNEWQSNESMTVRASARAQPFSNSTGAQLAEQLDGMPLLQSTWGAQARPAKGLSRLTTRTDVGV